MANLLEAVSTGNARRQGNDYVCGSLVTHSRTAHSNLADSGHFRFQERGLCLFLGCGAFSCMVRESPGSSLGQGLEYSSSLVE